MPLTCGCRRRRKPATGWLRSTISWHAAPAITRITRAPWRASRRAGASRRCRPISGRRTRSGTLTVQAPAPIREFTTRDTELIRREVLASGEPAVLRGLVSDWPAVAAARTSPVTLLEYLRRLDSGAPVDAIMTAPEIKG